MSDLDLSRRAIAAGWRWQAGALALPEASGIALRAVPVRIVQVYEEGGLLVAGSTWSQGKEIGGLWEEYRCKRLPDFNDPATRGVLLAQVREAHDSPTLFVMPVYGSRWQATKPAPQYPTHWLGWGEVEALIVAFEAAPERKS